MERKIAHAQERVREGGGKGGKKPQEGGWEGGRARQRGQKVRRAAEGVSRGRGRDCEYITVGVRMCACDLRATIGT